MNNKKRDPLPPILGLTIGVLASSTASIFIRFAQESAASLVIAAYRVGIATLILGLILMLRKDVSISELKGSNRQLAAGAGAFLAIHFATWVSSLEYTTVASSVVLVSTSSLFVALLSPALLGKWTVHRNTKLYRTRFQRQPLRRTRRPDGRGVTTTRIARAAGAFLRCCVQFTARAPHNLRTL